MYENNKLLFINEFFGEYFVALRLCNLCNFWLWYWVRYIFFK